MRDASARSVATHFATCTVFSLSVIAAPFVPEAIALYAGIRYLTAFLYGQRQWRGPARIPLHLGKRGYRDATTRKRGAATWPIGLAGNQQVWLSREDLTQGCAFIGDDPTWHTQAIEQRVFGACLNQMGAIIIQDRTSPLLADRLTALARPFGRDRELARIDLHDPLSPLLRVSTKAIADALAGLGLSQAGLALNAALAPILDLIATRYRRNSLPLYREILDKDALAALLAGHADINGLASQATTAATTDGFVPEELLARFRAISTEDLERGRQDLAPYAHELAVTPGLSLSQGLELDGTLASRRLACIRPSSPLTVALMAALCTQALSNSDPDNAAANLVHLGDMTLPEDMAKHFLVSAAQAGVLASIALPSASEASVQFAERHCRVRFDHTVKHGKPETLINSTLKDCQFDLSVCPMSISAVTRRVST